jgi:hypothetical protein
MLLIDYALLDKIIRNESFAVIELKEMNPQLTTFYNLIKIQR